LLIQAPTSGQVRWRRDDDPASGHVIITICTRDRPGTLARAAGVLALHRISVLRAQAYSTSSGFALERFIVEADPGTAWDRLKSDLEAAYSGRLALEAHVEKKARDYRPGGAIAPVVTVDEEASQDSTVIEVRAPDVLGLLYALASALTDLDLDIHVAKIDTLGSRVVDVFYIRTLWGSPLDADQIGEVKRSIEHRVGRLFG
jgi:[protein-PII] uridylyltransferase